jgi:hypothetical protein
MGFLKKIGGALGKLPGSKALTKPINKLAGKTPGLKGMPAAFGMGPKKPIGPSPAVVGAGVGATPDMKMGMQPEMPPMQPEMQAPPMPMPMQEPVASQPNPQMGGQMNPQAMQLMDRMRQRNTGITGGMRRPMGPSFMG